MFVDQDLCSSVGLITVWGGCIKHCTGLFSERGCDTTFYVGYFNAYSSH